MVKKNETDQCCILYPTPLDDEQKHPWDDDDDVVDWDGRDRDDIDLVSKKRNPQWQDTDVWNHHHHHHHLAHRNDHLTLQP